MSIRLLELNPLARAAAWLSEHGSDHDGYQPEDILEAARESKLELMAVVPDWHSAGKISWRLRDAMPIDEEKNADANTLPPGADLIDHDGLFLVSSKIAKRLLDHGECSLDCVEMPLVVCSNSAHTPPIQWLQGTDDGRLIRMHHVRVSRGVLQEFAQSSAYPEATLAQREQKLGVSKTAILAAPWPYLPNCDKAQLSRFLADPPKWLLDTNARVQKGAPGRDVAIWNPAKLAIALHGTKHFSQHKLTRVIKEHFFDFINEWDRYQDILLPA